MKRVGLCNVDKSIETRIPAPIKGAPMCVWGAFPSDMPCNKLIVPLYYHRIISTICLSFSIRDSNIGVREGGGCFQQKSS